jgi:hypothetical protein
VKGIIIGGVGVVGIGAAVVGGGGGPDDYIGTVSKSPEAVYAVFSELGPEGVTELPSHDGWDARVKQTVTKVPNENVKYLLEVDGKTFLEAEVQFTPADGGTRIAAELDFNSDALNDLLKEAGEAPIPSFAFEDFLMDQVFAQAMGEMARRIEKGEPLLSLSESYARWGSGGDSSSGRSRVSGTTPRGISTDSWQQRQAARPQLDARPTLNPNEAAKDVSRDSYGY